MCVIFIADREDEYYTAETDEDVKSYEEVNDEISIEASDGTKSLEMTSDEYYADEISEEEKEEVVNKDPTEEEELTIDDDGQIVEGEDFADIEGLGDHCVLEKHSSDENSLDRGQYHLVECKTFPK
jgi:hypothetical protein